MFRRETFEREAVLHALKQHFICDKSDKFSVSRLFVVGIDPYAEKGVDIFDFASVPGNLYRVADGALDF